MGKFVNPDNSAFQVALNSEIYIDKTGLLDYTNKVIDTKQALICNSRPRRFGKSITADMMVAYYSRGCVSEEMFKGLRISDSSTFEKHLNQYDVIHFDVQWCMTPAKGAKGVVSFIEQSIIQELGEIYSDILPETVNSLPDAMSYINAVTKRKFVVIIDEWDVPIRDNTTDIKVQERYIDFLRGMFKGSEPTKYIHLAYLTGILPIKKEKAQSALNNFDEFTMLDAKVFAPYVGFTDEEVRFLCAKYNKKYEEVKRWYNGYILEEYQVYNPKAVVSVMLWNKFQSYWTQTGTYESIVPLISMNFDGLKTDIVTMISGGNVKIKAKSYQNDMVHFKNKDDVITALIHLGYFAYDCRSQTAFIPNEEIRSEFADVVEETKWNEFIDFMNESNGILEATLEMDTSAVEKAIELIHTKYVSSFQYNDENSLSSVITIAYLSAIQYYFKPVREFPTGKGFADVVFIPKIEYAGNFPLLIVELKWNKTAQAAIEQIKEKKYTENLNEYTELTMIKKVRNMYASLSSSKNKEAFW